MSKEKQIEEIKEHIDNIYGCDCFYFGVDGLRIAHELYNAGYRKQSEGEWKRQQFKSRMKFLEYNDFTCIECGENFEVGQGKEFMHFCPNCGAKMKGGAE